MSVHPDTGKLTCVLHVTGGGDPRGARFPVIVVDASVLMEVLLRTPAAVAVRDRLLSPEQTLHAPHLIDIEMAQVLRRYAASGRVAHGRCRDAMEDLLDFPLERYPHDLLLRRVWELRHNLTAYDAVYVARAERSMRRS
jgi:predicted nucleic acid-binding protein